MSKYNNENTIELQNFSPENFININQHESDVNTSRVPLVKTKKTASTLHAYQLLIEKQFRKLNSIINLKSIMPFIYRCLALELAMTLYDSYLLIDAFMTILNLYYTPIYLIDYGISIFNALLYLQVIIIMGDYKKELEKKKEIDENKPKTKFKIKEEHLILPTEDVCITLNKPIVGLRNIYIFRFVTWHIKYAIYILLMGIESDVSTWEYLKIVFLLGDYYLYHVLKFYYKILLRIEAYKLHYGLEDPE